MKRVITLLAAFFLIAALCIGCGGSAQGESAADTASGEEVVPDEESGAAEESVSGEESAAEEETGSDEVASAEETAVQEAELEDGFYLADFDTDSSMFHVNESCDGKGTLTVENGVMTIHVSLVSKNIVNLYYGLAEDAQQDGAELIEPTLDTVTYSDGYTEEVYGFDIPVPALDTEYNVAIIGTKDNWYDHTVSVSNPEMLVD
ncbi:MAG: hypothetical protein LUD73_04715 [Lachnospiraceae bacterium]|nr:hypothetical protein [Lachnospiraceae bacterium]